MQAKIAYIEHANKREARNRTEAPNQSLGAVERRTTMSKLGGKNKNSKEAEAKRMKQQLAALERRNAEKAAKKKK